MLFVPTALYLPAQAAIKIIALFAAQSVIAFVLLEIVNYIGHCGLQRQLVGDTGSRETRRPEPFGTMQAWNAAHRKQALTIALKTGVTSGCFPLYQRYFGPGGRRKNQIHSAQKKSSFQHLVVGLNFESKTEKLTMQI